LIILNNLLCFPLLRLLDVVPYKQFALFSLSSLAPVPRILIIFCIIQQPEHINKAHIIYYQHLPAV